jgi:hypothetical protein
MANQFGTNPMTITATMAAPYTANLYIGNIIWSDTAAAGNELTIIDRNGNLIVDVIADGIDETVVIQRLSWVQGFQVTVLTAGSVSIVVNK